MLVLFSLIRPRDLVQRHPTRALRHVENRFPNVPALHVVLQLPAGIPIELVSAPGASGQTSEGKSLKVISLWFSQSLPWFCISKVSKKEMSNQKHLKHSETIFRMIPNISKRTRRCVSKRIS